MKNLSKIGMLILLTVCQVAQAGLQEEASISAETLISKASSIANNFPSPDKVAKALGVVTQSTDLESPDAKVVLADLGITNKNSSVAKLVTPYEQEKTTRTIATWLKNYESNKQFYTNPDQQAVLQKHQGSLAELEKTQELAAKLHTYLAQNYKK